MSRMISLWTQQAAPVVAALQEQGVCQVKAAYIAEKYGETAWSFRRAYEFFSRRMKDLLPPPSGCESPYWLHGTAAGTGIFSETALLHFSIPEECCLFFDSRDWNRLLNLSFLGTPAAEAAFHAELARMGIHHDSEVFRYPYYPLQKAKIMDSWNHLFKERQVLEPAFLQAAVWELRKEWILK